MCIIKVILFNVDIDNDKLRYLGRIMVKITCRVHPVSIAPSYQNIVTIARHINLTEATNPVPLQYTLPVVTTYIATHIQIFAYVCILIMHMLHCKVLSNVTKYRKMIFIRCPPLQVELGFQGGTN